MGGTLNIRAVAVVDSSMVEFFEEDEVEGEEGEEELEDLSFYVAAIFQDVDRIFR